MRRLPIVPANDNVDEIEIASPCSVPWDGMRGDERVRFCEHCRQNVYNIESFTRVEARRLIEAREGRMCVRILRRDDGTVVTSDCWSRLRAARRRGWLAFATMLVIIGWTQLSAMRFGWQALSQWLRPGPAPCPIAAAGDAVPSPAPLTGAPVPITTRPTAGEIPPKARPRRTARQVRHIAGGIPPRPPRSPHLTGLTILDD